MSYDFVENDDGRCYSDLCVSHHGGHAVPYAGSALRRRDVIDVVVYNIRLHEPEKVFVKVNGGKLNQISSQTVKRIVEGDLGVDDLFIGSEGEGT